jgi:hypothetical protein
MDEARVSKEYHWEGTHVVFGEKTSDWYFAVVIIAAAGIIVSVLFNNILLALVILTGTAALIIEAKRPASLHRFGLSDDGITIDTLHVPFDKVRSFSILEYMDHDLPPVLSIKTSLILSSHLLIPIHDHDAEEMYAFLEQHIEEGRHENHLIDRILEKMKL